MLTGGLALFIIDKKWSRAALFVLVPLSGALAYILTKDALTIAAALTGAATAALAPFIVTALGKTGAADTVAEEEDILDTKVKWRLIIAGYVIFILFAVFSVISIIRLNAKINTLYGFTQDLEKRIEETDTGKK